MVSKIISLKWLLGRVLFLGCAHSYVKNTLWHPAVRFLECSFTQVTEKWEWSKREVRLEAVGDPCAAGSVLPTRSHLPPPAASEAPQNLFVSISMLACERKGNSILLLVDKNHPAPSCQSICPWHHTPLAGAAFCPASPPLHPTYSSLGAEEFLFQAALFSLCSQSCCSDTRSWKLALPKEIN